MDQSTSTAASVQESAHEQLLNIVTDNSHDAAYIEVAELYPHMPLERVWAFVIDTSALTTQAAGWDILPGCQAQRDDALKLADVLADEFLTEATVPTDPFAVESWNEQS